MSRRGALLLSAAVLLVGLLVAAFLLTYRYVETQVWVGPNGPARTNEFYAVERFLDAMQVPTRSATTVSDLPDPQGGLVLWLARERQPIQSRARQLEDWVRRGGHLIVTAAPLEPDGTPPPDPLLDPLGVHASLLVPGKIQPGDVPPGLEGAFPPGLRLEYGDAFRLDYQVGPQDGAWVLGGSLGKGQLTVLVTADFLTNQEIGEGARATWLWKLARFLHPRAALVVYRDETPGLFKLLRENAWPLLVSLGVLLAVWLYDASRRFGPLQARRERGRRSLLEHLDATARYLWQAGEQRALLDHAREDLWERCRRRRPELADLPLDTQSETFGELAGAPPPLVKEALFSELAHQPEAFTRAIRTLEQVRRAL